MLNLRWWFKHLRNADVPPQTPRTDAPKPFAPIRRVAED
jgi:hypothetical protein